MRTIQAQVVGPLPRILLYKADGMTFQQIADKLAISTATVPPLYFEVSETAVLDAGTV